MTKKLKVMALCLLRLQTPSLDSTSSTRPLQDSDREHRKTSARLSLLASVKLSFRARPKLLVHRKAFELQRTELANKQTFQVRVANGVELPCLINRSLGKGQHTELNSLARN